MEVKLQKWGNSIGIRIPNYLLKSLNLDLNDIVEIKEENKSIVIVKKNIKKISLKERINSYKGNNNLSKDFSWDDPVGKELW